ncbi:MAG: toprim domain-containing protein [Bacteroidales bacterium]|nr:toprim domain-containing protein [Bacteroidales bacterium]
MAEELIRNTAAQDYNEDNIRTLEGMEHIRQRPGMYIGQLGNGEHTADGIYVLLKEVVDNSIDEFRMHAGKQINITVTESSVTVRDFGRGIPLGKVVAVSSILNTGGKFDDKAFVKSVGMNGVGIKATNALSVDFFIESYRDGKASFARYRRGKILEEGQREAPKEKNGTYVEFTPDPLMFVGYHYRMDLVQAMIKNYSYLNKGLALNFNGETFKSENGLLDLVNDSLTEAPLYPPIHIESEDIEIVFTHGNKDNEDISSFVNGQFTRDGGTHLAAFREAVARTLKEFYKKDYDPQDIREGIIGAVSMRVQEPNFANQAKTKMSSVYMWEKPIKDKDGAQIDTDKGPTIRGFVNDFMKTNLDNYLHIHKEIQPIIQEKIVMNEKIRKQKGEVSEKIKVKRKKDEYNPKLRDCRYHYNDKPTKDNAAFTQQSSIFITEGDSASGTFTLVRDANTQAVFSLRGKPINCFKESAAKVSANQELTLLISALGVEEDLDNLRYNNIIVATDADDDGMHIRLLVLTFLLKFYPDLIRGGHVYILETPLFRVKGKKESRYCFSREEKDEAVKAFKGQVELTRFKGLGEISPAEFKDFIGPEMRLTDVTLSHEESIKELLTFYMGDNTQDRQDFIRTNLRSLEEMDGIDI